MKLKIALALMLIGNFAPTFAESEEVSEMEVLVDASSELKDLINSMKEDRTISKERVQRLKELIKEKGWTKKSDKKQSDAENEQEPA